MKISNIIKTLLVVCATSQAFALTFYGGKRSAPREECMSLKYSSCQWGSSADFETPPLPGKPGINDTLGLRYGHYRMEIDANVNVGEIACGDAAQFFAKGKTIKVRKGLRAGVCGRGGTTLLDFDKCTLTFGGNYSIGYFEGARTIGNGVLRLKDSKFLMEGALGCIIPAHPLVQPGERGGYTLDLIGDTEFYLGGGTVIDTIFREKPTEWAFKIKITEKDGKIPTLRFGDTAEFTGCDLEISATDKLKQGEYVLMQFNDKKSGIGRLTRFTFNGQKYSLGQSVNVGGKSFVVNEKAVGRNSKSDKNIVLTVK